MKYLYVFVGSCLLLLSACETAEVRTVRLTGDSYAPTLSARILDTPPSRPYKVIGEVTVTHLWNYEGGLRGAEGLLMQKAKEMGADAVIRTIECSQRPCQELKTDRGVSLRLMKKDTFIKGQLIKLLDETR